MFNFIRYRLYKVNPNAVTEFMNSQSAKQAVDLIEKHPELLGDKCMKMVQSMEDYFGEHENEIPQGNLLFKRKNVLLKECRKLGIKKVKNKYSSAVEYDNENYAKIFTDFVFAESWNESRSMLERNPMLMRSDLSAVIEHFIKSCDDDNTNIRFIQHIEILNKCSKKNPREVFDDLISLYGDKKPGLDKLFMTYFDAQDKKQIKRILAASPELYSEYATGFLASRLLPLMNTLAGNMKIEDNIFSKRISLLNSCREKGTARALLEYYED
ncbi:MAG: hypothetical protein Q8920_13355 [Bacillota bacterium]|nr:hypothetical protein [Bacillota bacterium]